jgi:hypothetical protein
MHCELQSLTKSRVYHGHFKHAACGNVLRKNSKLHPVFALKNKIRLCFQYKKFKLQWTRLSFRIIFSSKQASQRDLVYIWADQ